MGIDARLIRVALRQQLEGDLLLGIKSVPMHPPPLSSEPRASARADSTQVAGLNSHGSPHGLKPPVSEEARRAKGGQLNALDEAQVKGCTKCSLCESRTQTVFGQGDPAARLVFVGEAPGYEEDKQGLAFVGRAGQLLTRMIAAMGLSREDVFICNVLKCRPPGNRDPSADEILACSGYLRQQLEVIQPEVLVALGSPAAKTLLNTVAPIGKLRGRFHDYYLSGVTSEGSSIPLMPTYHPAYLLRNPAEKRKTWEDLQMVMRRLGLLA